MSQQLVQPHPAGLSYVPPLLHARFAVKLVHMLSEGGILTSCSDAQALARGRPRASRSHLMARATAAPMEEATLEQRTCDCSRGCSVKLLKCGRVLLLYHGTSISIYWFHSLVPPIEMLDLPFGLS